MGSHSVKNEVPLTFGPHCWVIDTGTIHDAIVVHIRVFNTFWRLVVVVHHRSIFTYQLFQTLSVRPQAHIDTTLITHAHVGSLRFRNKFRPIIPRGGPTVVSLVGQFGNFGVVRLKTQSCTRLLHFIRNSRHYITFYTE